MNSNTGNNMFVFGSVFVYVAALLHTGVTESIVRRNAAADQSCSYNINQLQASISAQHASIENKLNALLAGASHNQSEAGSSTSAAGVNYKRWGRTTCPAKASLVYAGGFV